MANIASQTRYIIPYGSVGTETGTGTILDQVDNNTNGSAPLLCKIYVNRMNEKYHREDERLQTFANWPLSWLDKYTLAQTGMFFTNEGDKVKCYFCEVEIGRWEPEDLPVPEHLRWSPNCPLLRRRTTNNVPLNAEALDTILPPISYDICGSHSSSVEVHENAYSEGRSAIATAVTSMPEPCSHPAGATTNGGSFYPAYPEYAIETARLRSYEDWPRNMKQKPQQLAEAGFFYTGVGDRVRCFSCGGGLKDWDDNDEPWEQHALWLNQCRFVRLIRGQRYIDTIASKAAAAATQEASKPAAEKRDQLLSNSVAASAAPAPSPASDSAPAPVAAAQTATESLASAGVAATPAVESGDVAPSTAAARIYEKIVAQNCPEGSASANPMSGPATAIREEKLCKICYADEYNTAFLPCGHVVACAKCASSVTKCPLCRKPFTDVMRVYFS